MDIAGCFYQGLQMRIRSKKKSRKLAVLLKKGKEGMVSEEISTRIVNMT
jgi:hypothetical protein